MTVTSHRITASLPVRVGHGECRDTVHVKADIDFNYTPGTSGRRYSDDVEALKCTPINDDGCLTRKEWRELAQEYLDDGGYDLAVSVAKEQRGE